MATECDDVMMKLSVRMVTMRMTKMMMMMMMMMMMTVMLNMMCKWPVFETFIQNVDASTFKRYFFK